MTTINTIVATYGEQEWMSMAARRAIPTAFEVGEDNCTVLHEFEGTRASSLNNAAEMATGDLLIFLDADDELEPGFIAAMRRAVESEDPAWSDMAGLGTVRRGVARQGETWVPPLFTPSVRQVRKGRPGNPFFYPECDLRTGNWLVIGTMINREFFNQLGGFREHPHGLEDWNLWARAVRAGARIVKVPDAVYRAHMNPRSEHHKLQRNRPEYMVAYEAARQDAWG